MVDNAQQCRRCLIANDSEALLYIVTSSLSKHFDEVKKCFNGSQAVDIVTKLPANYYNVIILDIDMPIMNGKEACRLILDYFG